jgi:uncharacterized protein (UPF0303 family)
MSMNTPVSERLALYRNQEYVLCFKHFSNQDAWDLGQMLVAYAKKRAYSVAIDIAVSGYQLFRYGFAGTNNHNEMWMQRKMNTVNTVHKSSIHVGAILENTGEDLEDDWHLPHKDYAFHGGCFPIIIEKTGFIGTITVSGRPQHEDHQMIIDVLGDYLSKTRQL